MHDYLNAAFDYLEAPTTSHHDQLSWAVHGSVTLITDGLRTLVETVKGLRGTSAIGH